MMSAPTRLKVHASEWDRMREIVAYQRRESDAVSVFALSERARATGACDGTSRRALSRARTQNADAEARSRRPHRVTTQRMLVVHGCTCHGHARATHTRTHS